MSRGALRLLQLSATVFGLLLGLEVLCRVQPDGLAAVAHRVRFKLALLHAKGPVDFVALGSSRTNDGLNPALLGLGAGFSAATPSSSLPTLEYFAEHLGPQRRVFVELSVPMSSPNAMDLDPAPTSNNDGDPIGALLQEHSALIRVRRAFALENLPRVLGLLFASSLDGSEWFRSRQLIETFRPPLPPPGVQDDAAWKPFAHDLTTPRTLDTDGERIVAGYTRALTSLRNGGAKVVLMSPPLGAGWRVEECTPERIALRAEVARRTAAPLLDFTCAEVDERWFVDGQHLSSPGRAKYSQVLGEALRALP
jgi:hypothetical protein